MANRAKRQQVASSVTVLEPEQEPQDQPPRSTAVLLPELPPYIERVMERLNDDKGLRGKNLTKEQKSAFCRMYAETGSLRLSSEHIGCEVNTVYHHLDIDEAFADAFSMAKLHLLDDIQSTSVSMAKKEKGVVDRMCQMKRLAPQVYRESPGVTIMSTTINAGGLR